MSCHPPGLVLRIVRDPPNASGVQPVSLSVMKSSPLEPSPEGKPLSLPGSETGNETKPMSLQIMAPSPTILVPEVQPLSRHLCYVLKSARYNRIYIGYTVDFPHRLRQHNGEIAGGAKKTRKWRPWGPICVIRGFEDSSTALRFEYRLQHSKPRRRAGEDSVIFSVNSLTNLITRGDGSVKENNKRPWPVLEITWYDVGYTIRHARIINHYVN